MAACDLHVNISPAVRARHWLMPVDPAAYRRITPAVLKQLPAAPTAPMLASAPGVMQPSLPKASRSSIAAS